MLHEVVTLALRLLFRLSACALLGVGLSSQIEVSMTNESECDEKHTLIARSILSPRERRPSFDMVYEMYEEGIEELSDVSEMRGVALSSFE